MKWTRLQLNSLPVVAVEADNAILKLEDLINRVSLTALHEDIEQLNSLRESILARIDALDRFYDQNCTDSTISIFHMIKLKLKRAVFKVQNIYNETISIELMSPNNQAEPDSYSRINDSSFKKLDEHFKTETKANKGKFQIKPKLKSKSKNKAKDDILRLLETSRRSEEETNLMDQVNAGKHQFYDHSFDFNNNQDYDPLFGTDHQHHQMLTAKQQKQQKQVMKSQNDIKIRKSLSPFTKKKTGHELNTTNENIKHSPFKSKNIRDPAIQTQNKQFPKLSYATAAAGTKLNNTKATNFKKANIEVRAKRQQEKKLKTQGDEIRILEQGNAQQSGQFRFTIKMTKEDYKNLLKMKETLKSTGKLG